MNALCFTSSYQRGYYLRSCIQNIKNQSYPYIHHSISINIDSDIINEKRILYTINDLISPCQTISINKNSNINLNNHLNCFKIIDIDKYDIFIKIDDDDIHKKKYVENIVNYFKNNDTDILTSKVEYVIRDHNEIKRNYKPKKLISNKILDPCTIAFNKKALEILLNTKTTNRFFDIPLIKEFEKHNLKFSKFNNSDQIIYHIHKKNISI